MMKKNIMIKKFIFNYSGMKIIIKKKIILKY